jgi:formylglycine-generating enzyme required for sulfatase activity
MFTNTAVGSYTLTWGVVSGWTRPSPAAVTQTLPLGGVVTFSGLYVENAGFVSIPPGVFMMGSHSSESGRSDDETQHQVTLTYGVYVQTAEVTNQQYRNMAQWAYDRGYLMAGSNSVYDNLDGSTALLYSAEYMAGVTREITFSAGIFSCINPTHPVQSVTWYGAAAYCDWLSLQQGLPRAYDHSTWQCNSNNPYTAGGYRLPTEAEWEYACRAGTQTAFSTGYDLTEANYGRLVGWTTPVGSYQANAFGVYDMHGNVAEWCNDWYGTYGGTVTDPVGGWAGGSRVIRGGDWALYLEDCRSARRSSNVPDIPNIHVGFRPVRSAF